jgi:hypothetical protein
VLLAPLVHTPELTLVLQRWRRQLRALFKSLRFKVLLAIGNIPTHVWSVDNVQMILRSSYIVSEPSPRSVHNEDMSIFLVATWDPPGSHPKRGRVHHPRARGALR